MRGAFSCQLPLPWRRLDASVVASAFVGRRSHLRLHLLRRGAELLDQIPVQDGELCPRGRSVAVRRATAVEGEFPVGGAWAAVPRG